MASNPSAGESTSNEGSNYLLKGYEYINGTIDFARYAADEGISVEAARKRFKRAFVSNRLNVNTRGDNIGPSTAASPRNTSSPAKTTKSGSSTTTPNTTKAIKREAEVDGDETADSAARGTPASKKQKSTTSAKKATVEDAPDALEN